MEHVLQILGFTSYYTVLWNCVGYIAFLTIIAGVLIPKPRALLLTLGSGALALYSYVFLESMLFSILQGIVTLSALLQLLKIGQERSKFILKIFAVAAILILIFSGYLQTKIDAAGFIGFLAITLGVVILPDRVAFLRMAVGGMFLVFYAIASNAWVFFVLYAAFFCATLQNYNQPTHTKTA